MPRRTKKKLSLEDAAQKLAAIAEKHLSGLPEDEQDTRVAAFSRVEFVASRPVRGSRGSTGGRLPKRPF